jgi:hypothetical protein
VGIIVQSEEPNFGGYFCCEAGGTAFEFRSQVGVLVSPRVSLQGEILVPRSFTNELSAPRFAQENVHRDVVVSMLVGFHPGTAGRIRTILIAGGGLVFSRTIETVRFFIFQPGGTSLGPRSVIRHTETIPAVTLGTDFPILVTEHVRVVPQFRLRVMWRSDEARYQEGLGSFGFGPGIGVQVSF